MLCQKQWTDTFEKLHKDVALALNHADFLTKALAQEAFQLNQQAVSSC